MQADRHSWLATATHITASGTVETWRAGAPAGGEEKPSETGRRWGEQEAHAGRPLGGGELTLQPALEHTEMPRHHTNTPDRPQRPRWGERTWAEEMPQPTFDEEEWDAMKVALAEGRLHLGRGPWLP